MSFVLDLAWIFAAAYAINLAFYFGGGAALNAINRTHADRRIQPARDGMKRAAAEIRESLGSIAVTAACLALALALQMHGMTLWTPWRGWAGVVGGVLLLVALYDAWFYWAHRLMHTRRFYRFHHWHHRSVAPTVWSSDSQTVVETLLIQSFLIFAAVLLPVPPLALIVQRVYDHVNGQIGHCGFEYFADRTTRFPSPFVCTSFHDQHHELFNWNFANSFSIWDRLMGTVHPGYDAKVAATAAQAAKKAAK